MQRQKAKQRKREAWTDNLQERRTYSLRGQLPEIADAYRESNKRKGQKSGSTGWVKKKGAVS